jgi:hypothetical protein
MARVYCGDCTSATSRALHAYLYPPARTGYVRTLDGPARPLLGFVTRQALTAINTSGACIRSGSFVLELLTTCLHWALDWVGFGYDVLYQQLVHPERAATLIQAPSHFGLVL